MVIECTSHEQLVKDFGKKVQTVWKDWLQDPERASDSENAEQRRKDQLIALRAQYSTQLDGDTLTQIMKTEAQKYNNLRR